MLFSEQFEMLQTPIKEGSSHRKNRRVEFEGTFKELPSFEFGHVVIMTGKLTCWYHSSEILCVDFDKKQVTDFGMSGYSTSTTRNLHAWRAALYAVLRPSLTYDFCISVEALYGSSAWTASKSRYHEGQGWRQRRERFKSQAPWNYKDANGVWWFDWELFDPALSNAYYAAGNDLAQDQAWRYYTYDWDAQGKWSKRFIDADAERRYLARKKKRGPRGNVP